MKGIVFTEFLDMVEAEFGYSMVDDLIENSELSSNGIYTAVGTYHHSEIVTLLTKLSEKSKIPAEALLKSFGEYLFDTFLKQYPQFFSVHDDAFSFLESIDSHIHVEVLKLYPEATLPKFTTHVNQENEMSMLYQSERKMAALAEGLIHKSLLHYKEDCKVEKSNIKEDGSEVKFTIPRITK